MKQAVLEGVHRLVLKDVPRPEIDGPEQVLVRIAAATICGSDLHMLRGDHEPNQKRFPSPIGHEAAGVVEAVGASVADYKPGDRVAVKEYHNGCFADYTLTTPQRLLRLPAQLSYEEGAVLEPLGAVCALSHQCFRLGETVVITGQGPTGLLFTQTARAAGAYQVIVSEPHARKRELALQLGADVAIDPREMDVVEAVRDATRGEMADVVVEASSAPKVYPLLARLCRLRA